ncbi:MAG: SpaA isopeptide-forming pilin-related protein, partial [Defluviitaleaceae bacterium]|nr:SpaA isopeptide-forming pilin-related protein [Defluviitaleaceae bacterium]
MQLSGYFRNKLRPFMAMLLAFLTAISAIPMQPVQVFAYDGATEQAELHPWIGELLDIAYSEEPTIAPGGIAPFWDNIGGSGEQTWGRAVSFSSHPYVQNGTGISPIRYDLQRNGVNVEIYCADPHLPGPEQNSNYYVSGRMENPPPMLLNALRSGYPNNANLFLEDDYDNSDIAWAVYVTRVAVAYGFIGGRGTLTGDQAIINMARRMANGQLSVLQATRITVNGQQHVSENGEAVGSYSVAEFSMENHHLAHRPGSNPVAFSWMEGTPPGTQLRGPSGNVLATAPGLPGNNRFTTDMRFTIAVPFGSGSGGVGSAGVYIRGINNAYAGVWTANLRGDDPETRRGHQTMVFYIPVVEASAQMFFDQRSEVKIFKREMSNGIGNNQLLEGATFRIQGFYPGNPPIPIDRTATTNADGYVIFRDLPAGQFTITEIAPPSGYLLGENNVWVVNVGWGQTVEAGTAQSHTFFNYPKSSLEIMKICGITNEPLAGAVFELHDPTSGETWQATSGPNGIAIIGRGNYGNFLYPYRTYILREIVAPTGFVLINEPMTIVLSPGDENRVTIRNFRNPGLTIIKVCYDTGVALEGAVFQIEAIGTGTPISTDFSMITDAGGRIVIPYTLLDGEAERSFIIREIMPPPGFTLSEPSYQVVTMVQGRNNTVTFANRPMAYLEILKIDGDTGQPLPGAIFTVEGLDDAGNRTTWTITSNENGIARLASDRASSNPGMLVPGQTYIITEIQAPNGYVLMSGPIHHVMTHGRNTITWRNWFNPGLTIIKRCQDTQEPLAGAIFEIVAQGSGRPLPVDFPLVTDTNGRIIIPWTLFEGESERVFIVTEVVPPPGFHLSDSNRQVVTMQAGHDNTVTFYNRRKPTITIIKRDARTGEPIEGAEFNIEKIDEPGRGPLTGNPFRTDSQGRITLPFQHAGQYRITEIRAANNYWLDPLEQNRSWIINVRPNEDYVLHIENTLLPTLVITKWNMTTMLPVPLTHFRVEFEQPNSPNVVHIGDFVTDAQGMIVLPFVQPGWYRITEIFPAPGMALNANNSYRIFLNPGDNTYTLLPYLRGQGTGALSPPIESDAGVGPIDTEPNPNTSPESDTTLPDPEQSVDFPFTPVEWEAMNYSARQTFLRGQISVTDGSQWLASGGQNVFNWPLNSIVIKKVCSVTGQLLPDATFNLIHTSAGVSGTLGTVIGTYTTGPSGIIVITGL